MRKQATVVRTRMLQALADAGWTVSEPEPDADWVWIADDIEEVDFKVTFTEIMPPRRKATRPAV